jgi:XTP/dITP diphosphohydrolase
LTQKVYERVTAAGLPADLVPESLLSIAVTLGGDAEHATRAQTLEFMDTVRKVERNVVASRRGTDVPEELDSASLGVVTEDEWRAHWPTDGQWNEAPDADEQSQLVADELFSRSEPPVESDQDSSVEPQ